MASSENLRSSDQSYNESNDEKFSPLTTIVLMPGSTPPIPSLEIIDELNQPFLAKRKSTRAILMADVSRRLSRRKLLHQRL